MAIFRPFLHGTYGHLSETGRRRTKNHPLGLRITSFTQPSKKPALSGRYYPSTAPGPLKISGAALGGLVLLRSLGHGDTTGVSAPPYFLLKCPSSAYKKSDVTLGLSPDNISSVRLDG